MAMGTGCTWPLAPMIEVGTLKAPALAPGWSCTAVGIEVRAMPPGRHILASVPIHARRTIG
ncbi:hypothetical protein [uncultured Thiodictyon sp.]|uniref:hypothetical protein n=1 Tax=uncultured Thiodictyon sp. TaxID=1846217 RepID=UPI0025E9C3EF|nr:hypothetical protein [uncultured Thiodictyon sp.]